MAWYWYLWIVILAFVVATAIFIGFLSASGILIIRGKLQPGFVRLKVSAPTWWILRGVANDDNLDLIYDALDKQGTLFDITPAQIEQLLSHLKKEYNHLKSALGVSSRRKYLNAIKELTEQSLKPPSQATQSNSRGSKDVA